MKSKQTTPLPSSFTKDNHTFTQVKRNDIAAIYRREDDTGAFVSFEVFAIKSKNGMEIYPNKMAVKKKWCYCPVAEVRANTWFDRFTSGDVVIPNVDPETGESLEVVDNRSLDELPDVNVEQNTVQTLATVEVSVTENISVEVEQPALVSAGSSDTVNEFPTVDIDVPVQSPMDILVDVPAPAPIEETASVTVEIHSDIPLVDIPTVDLTSDGGAVVTVAKVRQNKVYPTMKLPTGEFLRDDFAEMNGFDFKPAHSDSYVPLMREIKEGRVVEVRKERRGPGKPRSIYMAVATPTV